MPWNLLNIAMASTNVPFWQFTIASAIGESAPTAAHLLPCSVCAGSMCAACSRAYMWVLDITFLHS